MRARYYCGDCLTARDFASPFAESGELTCVQCARAYRVDFASVADSAGELRCAFCGNRAFFVQRDFDQRLGCLAMGLSLAAALLIGWRFGWIYFTPVLLATVLIDWIVAARIKPVTICYRCDAEYRDLPAVSRYKGYDPHVAERYAEKKTLRRMR